MKVILGILLKIEKYWLLVAALGAFSFFLITLFVSTGQSVWFDEGYSILLAKSSYGELLSLTAVDAHPPLYYLLLKAWGDTFGYGEFALRSLSAALMAGAVFVATVLVRRMYSVRVALIALPFIILSPFVLRYGYEIRMYALATLIAVAATYALLRARSEKGRLWWGVYAVLVALGMYTLYMMAAVWLAHLVWLMCVSVKSKDRKPLLQSPWVYAFGGAIVLFVPYIATFFRQLTSSALPGIGNEITISQLAHIGGMLTMFTPEWSLGGVLSIVLIAGVTIASILAVRAYRSMTSIQKRYYLLILSLVATPVIFYALVSIISPIFIVRYMAHTAIFFSIFTGIAVAFALLRTGMSRPQRIRTAIASVGLLCMHVFGVVVLNNTGNFIFERMQHPSTALVKEVVSCDDSTQVIAEDPYTYIDAVYYFGTCPLYFFSPENVAYKGGYAMLHNSTFRVASGQDVTARTVIVLGWEGKDSNISLGSRYHKEAVYTFDKQRVTRYQLIAE